MLLITQAEKPLETHSEDLMLSFHICLDSLYTTKRFWKQTCIFPLSSTLFSYLDHKLFGAMSLWALIREKATELGSSTRKLPLLG